jgi:hypothetical protein
MTHVTPTTYWASVGIIASAIGGLFSMQMSHAGENGHSSMADQAEVSEVKIKIERIATEVNHNRELLGDLKDELRDLRDKQAENSEEILEAIRGG